MSKRKTPPERPPWQTDRYLLSLHRALYLATGDPRYRYAARPFDELHRSFRSFARGLRAKAAVPSPVKL